MPTLVELASRYRWELMLLVGIPFIKRTIGWLLPHILGNFNLSLDYWSCPPDYYCLPRYLSPFLNISLLLLGLFYFHVRRTGRPILSLLWAYAFVITAFWISMSMLLNAMDPEWWLRAPWSWWNEIQTFIHLAILMWFARQASKISFSHTLVLIGLSYFLFEFGLVAINLVFLPLEGRMAAWDIGAFALVVTLFAVWVLSRLGVSKEKHEADIERWIGSWDIPAFGTALRRLAVRVLPRFDPARGISKELLVALFGLYWLLSAFFTLRSWIGREFEIAFFIETMVHLIVYRPLWIVLVILLAYAVRVRQPREGQATNEPKAKPTKPFLCPRYGSQEEHPIS